MVRMVIRVLWVRLVIPDRPAIITDLLLRQIDPAVVPHVPVVEAAVARLHGHERGFRRVAGGLFEKGGARRAGVVLTSVKEG